MKRTILFMITITAVLGAETGQIETRTFMLSPKQAAKATIDWDKKYIVIDTRTEKIITLDVSEDMIGRDHGYEVEFEDINFDGYTDIGVPVGFGYGGVNIYRDYYLYDPKNRNYIKALSEIGNLEVETKEKILVSHTKSGQGYFHEWYRVNMDRKPYLIMRGDTLPDKEGYVTNLEAKEARVKVVKSYFYDNWDGKKLKSYIVKGDKVKILDMEKTKEGVYWVKVTYRGQKKIFRYWIKLKDLSFAAVPLQN